jgi:predicted metal-dependent HD superfamily phosphohydrolase
MRHLPEAWLRAAAAAGARGDVAQAGVDLLGRYAERHRHYHDLAHLDGVLRHVDELAGHARDAGVVRLAAWYHDAVYDPTAPDNEERSAQLAESALAQLRVADDVVAEVARLVRGTAVHAPEPGDLNAEVLCDADLAVLASGPERYQVYVDAVRAEYGHVDDRAFARGRAAVLRRLLARDPLFGTPTGRERWEEAARLNVAAELAKLERIDDS